MQVPIGEQVVVITGASQGIGRETALEMARRGARLVLAARNEEALIELAKEAERLGGQAEVVPTDVADHAQVASLGNRAMERFGRIDTWVNDAAVSIYARFDEMTPEELERVIRVNLLGQMFGSQVAVQHMKPILGSSTRLHEYDPGTWGPPEAAQLAVDVGGWHCPQCAEH
jgi:NAD(P)-dependent dehydrogenase (short-subunit alcohol dehydrogenase family)